MKSRKNALELVEQLRNRGLSNGSALGQHSGLYDEAADMIEELMKSKAKETPEDIAVEGATGSGCELCNNPDKWAAVFGREYKFGFPYVFAREQFFKSGKIKAAYCPVCGRDLKDGKA